jgi:MFS family permease
MRRSFFYGYVILALCFVNMAVMRGVNACFGVYYLALLETFSWSHREGASIASANFVVYALTAPLIGFAFDRFGPRLMMPVGGVLVGAGLLLSGYAQSLAHLYFSYGLLTALGQGALGFVGHSALISYWFVRRRATAIGIASMGQGFGALIMVPLTQFLIDEIGWRSTFVVTASLILVAVVPGNALFQRWRPEEVGQFPDGEAMPSQAAYVGRQPHSTGRENDPGSTWSATIRSFPFWSLISGHLALGTAVFMINTHMVAHLVSVGLDKLVAAFVFGLIGFIRIGGTLFWGFVSDRLGRNQAYAVSVGVVLVGLGSVIAIRADSPMWFVYLAAVIYSIGHSAGTPTYGAVIADVFSGRRVGLMFGLLEVGFGLGSAIGAWAGGYLFDVLGSYRWAFGFCLFCFVISALAIHACIKWQSRKLPHAR